MSLGIVSVISAIETESTTLVNAAEEALYQAKSKGRNVYNGLRQCVIV